MPGNEIDAISVAAYRIPTETPESDGTFEWDSTTLVAVHARSGEVTGFGYTYAGTATATLIRDHLAKRVEGCDAMAVEASWGAMIRSVRNLGRRGIAAMAISAVDSALWDLKAKLVGLPLVTLLGQVRDAAPVYGSGGFTSYSIGRLQQQLAGWVEEGIPRVKMKVGRDARADRERVAAARAAIGAKTLLFVDANGGYRRKLAIDQAEAFAEHDVRWFEEPVSSDDLEGLRLVRDRAPAVMDVAAGEYGYELLYFDRMLAAEAVDFLQIDATRACGITGFLKGAVLCESRSVPLSAHCAPSLHAALGCCVWPMHHLEYFFDHARIESMLFDGFRPPKDGALHPDLSRPGLGIELKQQDAQRYAV
ncbi:MAG TPA: enolase C-terminal domain-like protein [Thermoanaerobaculia bacterium]|nr:enolase C-terminal domain-like protein [Thermoanaerobaculia bacterium]